ncbi:MAG: uracil-DNA glycosylase family protein [Burkholderiales bacterium]
MSSRLQNLLREVRGCRVCEAHLPNPPNPVLRAHELARLLIVGQAPGRRVHESGIPWNDPSGDRLREWLQVTRETFYDETKVALIPAAFCYPGAGEAGDLPPRNECAPLWHPRLREQLPRITLTVLAGSYAQKYYFGNEMRASVAETVRAYRDFLPQYFPLPHPSWHNNRWMQMNPWFEREVLPELVWRARACLV